MKYCTDCKRQISYRSIYCKYCVKREDRNPNWKGDEVGYSALHVWVRRYLEIAKFCQLCNKKPPVDVANISQKYRRDLTDWMWLCRRCHLYQDGRAQERAIAFSLQKKLLVHGTSNGYSQWKCRCLDCKEAKRIQCKNWRDRNKDRHNANARNWRKRNLDKAKEIGKKYRQRKKYSTSMEG